MNEPTRLGEGGSELARRVLRAAREEGPSEASLQRTLTVLGVGASVLTVSSIAGSAAVGGASAALGGGATTAVSAAKFAPFGLLGVAVKWLGVGAVGGLMTAGALHQAASVRAPQSDTNTPATVQSATAAAQPARALRSGSEAAAPEQLPEPALLAPAAENRRSAQPRLVPPHASAPLAAEVAAVDRAREAVASGNAERALGELDAYDRGFAERRLMPEALYLRMEALAQRGDLSASQAVARRLLAADPNGPHAARARAVLAQR